MTSFAESLFGGQRADAAPEKDLLSSLANITLPVSDRARRHLVRVYRLLAVTIACAALGCLAHLRYGIGGGLTHLLSVGLSIAIAATSFSNAPPTSTWLKGVENSHVLLAAFGVCTGASVGPLVQVALFVDPSLILTALLLTANTFVCFSLTALWIPRRSLMALSGFLSSSLTFLFWLSLLSMFYPTVFAHSLQLYLGLAVFCGYITVDTQQIIDRADQSYGRAPSVTLDAMKMFTNLVAIFVRILIILIQEQWQAAGEEREQKEDQHGETLIVYFVAVSELEGEGRSVRQCLFKELSELCARVLWLMTRCVIHM